MARKLFPYPVETQTLANGLQIVAVPMPSNGLVSFWSIVRTGSRDEVEPGRTGFAHFFEHMMFRGTERYPADLYQKILIELGADANAFTTDDLTAYHQSIAAEDLERVMELESDRFRFLKYSEVDFKTEAGAVYGEYRKDKTDPLFVLYEAVRETAFEAHTYGHTTMGYERDIIAMPSLFEYSQSFFERYYRPENTSLLVVGDIDPAKALQLAERHYADWRGGYAPPAIPPEPEQRQEKRVDARYQGQTLPLIWLAYKIGRSDPHDRVRAAADLLVELTYGETSDCYRQLVLQDQQVEFLAAYAKRNRDPSLLDIYARIKDPAALDRVLAALDSAAERACNELVAVDRLENLKTRERYSLLMQLETPNSVAEACSRPLAVHGNLDALDIWQDSYDSLTPDDLREAARAIFSRDRRTVGVLQAA